jgi:hypothetical protein
MRKHGAKKGLNCCRALVRFRSCLFVRADLTGVGGSFQSFASASYLVAKKFERLVGSVALNDDVLPERLREAGSPVCASVAC